MRRIAVIIAALLCVLPLSAQKLSKEERAAAAKLAYEAALQSINERTWVIVPQMYTLSDGSFENISDVSVFLSAEGQDIICQGAVVGGNDSQGYLAEATEYDVKVDKKGNIKLRMVVSGRMWKGTYTISVRRDSNNADVIFNPTTGDRKQFSGPIVPLVGATYNKRSNPL